MIQTSKSKVFPLGNNQPLRTRIFVKPTPYRMQRIPFFLLGVDADQHATTCNHRRAQRKKAHLSKIAERRKKSPPGDTDAVKSLVPHNKCRYNNTENMNVNRKMKTFQNDERSSFSARRTRVNRTCPWWERSNIKGI